MRVIGLASISLNMGSRPTSCWACRAVVWSSPPGWRALQRPLDVLIVRKIGHPWQREFAVGALAEPDVVVFDQTMKWKNPLARAELDEVIMEEKKRLREYRLLFHSSAAPVLEGKMVLLVDDGLATGATAEAAVISARQQRRVASSSPRPWLQHRRSNGCGAWRMKWTCCSRTRILGRWANTMPNFHRQTTMRWWRGCARGWFDEINCAGTS